MSIHDYCQCMKVFDNSLHDVEHAVSKPQLVLNFLCGLNRKFFTAAESHSDATAITLFASACNALILKEICLTKETTITTARCCFVCQQYRWYH